MVKARQTAQGKEAAQHVEKQPTKKQGTKPKAAKATTRRPSKKNKQEGQPPAAAAKAVPPKAGAAGSGEIDELFGKLKGKGKADAAAAVAAAGAEPTLTAKEKPKKVEGNKDDIFGTVAAEGRKRTEEGYAIYSETELGLGKAGGNTNKCPFDCDCCF